MYESFELSIVQIGRETVEVRVRERNALEHTSTQVLCDTRKNRGTLERSHLTTLELGKESVTPAKESLSALENGCGSVQIHPCGES